MKSMPSGTRFPDSAVRSEICLNTAAVETGKNISPERLIEINNIIQELAESEANLKATLLEEAEEGRASE